MTVRPRCSRTIGESCNFEFKESGKDEVMKHAELVTNVKIMRKSVLEDERFRAHLEYGVPDQSEDIQEHIQGEKKCLEYSTWPVLNEI